MTPRVRGRVGKGDDENFYVEMSLWEFTGEKMIGKPWEFGPYPSEKIAHEEMRGIAKFMCDSIAEYLGETPNSKYLDMLNKGTLTPWEKH